jgi:hypothetical protein
MSYFNGPRIISDGLVLCLDAGNSKSYPGSGTTWNDLSGNNNNGTLVNGVGYAATDGGALSFDGSNDYISFNSLTTSSLGLTSSNGGTLSCWIKLTLLSRWTGVFVFWSTAGVCDFGWDINTSNQLRIWKGSAATTSSLLSYSNLWTNYVLVSNSSGTIFYINGNQFTTTSTSGNVPFNSGRNLMFGNHWDNPIQGNSAQVSIYNKALTAQEIQQNYNALKGRFNL